MATMHFTKKEFIAELEKTIKDDEHIILSNDIDGSIQVNKKRKFKQIPFAFACDAFAQPDHVSDLFGIGHLGGIVQKATIFSVIIGNDDLISEKLKNPVSAEQHSKETKKTSASKSKKK